MSRPATNKRNIVQLKYYILTNTLLEISFWETLLDQNIWVSCFLFYFYN